MTKDIGTADYAPDLMSSIFILGLEDSYTREKLFQMRPKAGKSTVEFDKLVKAASEIATAKENCAEAITTSVCGTSGREKFKKNSLGIVIQKTTIWLDSLSKQERNTVKCMV